VSHGGDKGCYTDRLACDVRVSHEGDRVAIRTDSPVMSV
jgi:hypothetical protein